MHFIHIPHYLYRSLLRDICEHFLHKTNIPTIDIVCKTILHIVDGDGLLGITCLAILHNISLYRAKHRVCDSSALLGEAAVTL